MTDTEVIVKGELHSSRSDLNESIDLIEDGVDHLIIEDAERRADYPQRHLWFQLQMWLFTHFFFNRFYTDHTILKDIADQYDANVIKTRSSNSALLNNASRADITTAFLVSFTFITGGVLVGYLFSGWWSLLTGAGSFTLGMIAAPLLLRVEESEREDDNRDELIAGKVADAAEAGGRVVAVIGDKHRQPVVENLPEWVDSDPRPRAYGWYHPRGLLTVGMAVLILLSSYGVVYALILFSLKIVLSVI